MITRYFGAALVVFIFHCSMAERFFNDQTRAESDLTQLAITILYMSLWILLGAIGFYGPGLWMGKAVGLLIKQKEFSEPFPITGFKVYHYIPLEQFGVTTFPLMITWYEYFEAGSDKPETLKETQATLAFEASYDSDQLVVRTYSLPQEWMDLIAVPKNHTCTFALVGRPQDIKHFFLPDGAAFIAS